MSLPTSEDEWVQYLSVQHDAEIPELEILNSYYEGTQNLAYMHPEVFREVGDRIKPVIIAWPQLVVDALEERMDVEGFRLPDEDGEDKELWRVWQSNNMDEQTQLGNVDALVMKRYYVSVGANEDDSDTPLLCAESPLEMYAEVDPRTRKNRAALRRVIDDSSYAREPERSATLYLPNSTIHYGRVEGAWKEQEQTRDNHNLGTPPVAAIVNRGRLSSARTRNTLNSRRARYGKSELDPIIPLSNAVNIIATDMMLGADFVALPVRGFYGIGPDDLKDIDGNKLTAYQALLKKFLTIPVGTDEGAGHFEFAGANLTGFHDSMNSLARMVASLAGLPPDYMGLSTDNPPSAESRLAGEIRLIKRAERKQRVWGGAYEQVCRLVRRFQEGDWDPALKMLETRWRDPSTPTVAQAADAAIKLYTAPGPGQRPIVSLRQVRETLRFTDAQIRRMEKDDDEAAQKAAALDPVGVLADRIASQNQPGPSGANGA